MIKIYLFFSTMVLYLSAFAQPVHLVETVGNAPIATPVNSYTGWTNTYTTMSGQTGSLKYAGSAVVEDNNPSNYNGASGGSNVYFSNTPGTDFLIGNFLPYYPDFIHFSFGMFGYDTANHTPQNDLQLYVSRDSGIN